MVQNICLKLSHKNSFGMILGVVIEKWFMKRRLILIALCFVCFSFAGNERYLQTQSDTILWTSTRKLTWDDFKGKPNEKSEYKAITSVVIDYKNELSQSEINYEVACFFCKNIAWSKTKSVELLKHEQLHFDIAELVTRKIRRDMIKYVSTNLTETEKFVNKVNNKYFHQELDSINQKYDLETNHSINKTKQKEWELKIAQELKNLEKYSSTKVLIKRVK